MGLRGDHHLEPSDRAPAAARAAPNLEPRLLALGLRQCGWAESDVGPKLGLGGIGHPLPRHPVGEAEDEPVAGRLLAPGAPVGRIGLDP